MSKSIESTIHEKHPGVVRLFWWRTDRRARLAMTGLGVVTAVATVGAVGFAEEALPRGPRSSGPEAAVHRGDSFEAVVHTVSDVDSFEGVEPATGLFFRARVAGLLRPGCRLPESRDIAQNLLRGKNVRLVVKNDGGFDGDRMAVDVVLPDGTDYARTVVRAGMAVADLGIRDDLASVESAARQEHLGRWGAGCAVDGTSTATTVSSEPSASEPVPATTTAAVTTTEVTASTSTSPPVTTSSTSPGSWLDVLLGRQCYDEGARRTSANGQEMVCERNSANQLRWRRAR